MGNRGLPLLLLILVACGEESGPPARTAPEAAPGPRPSTTTVPVVPPVESAPGFELPPLPLHDLLTTYPDDAYERLSALHSRGPVRVDEATYEAACADVAAAGTHLERLLADPRYRHESILRSNVRHNPRFETVEFEVVSRAPWLIFLEKPKGDRFEPLLANDRYADHLAALHDEFRKLLGDGVELPALDRETGMPPIVLQVFVFRERESYRQSERVREGGSATESMAYFDRHEPWLITCERNVTGELERYRRHLLYAGTQQLLQCYRWAKLRRRFGSEVDRSDSRTRCKALWFEIGVSELLSVARVVEGGGLEFLLPNLPRLELLKEWRAKRGKAWALPKILQVTTEPDLRRKCRSRDGIRDEGYWETIFSCQAWTWVHFLWFFEHGKYRSKLLRYARRDLRGDSGPEAFAEAWGVGEDHKWGPVEWEWRTHVAKLLKLVD